MKDFLRWPLQTVMPMSQDEWQELMSRQENWQTQRERRRRPKPKLALLRALQQQRAARSAAQLRDSSGAP